MLDNFQDGKCDLKLFSGDTNDHDETSTEATTEPADSDLTSNITTEQEDTPTKRDWLVRKMLSGVWDSKQTSTFIQRILYEDSCAGVAVVDLFVALKRAKDEIDVLARLNNEVVGRIQDLNLKAGVATRDYKVLSTRMQSLKDRIDAEAEIWTSTEKPSEDRFQVENFQNFCCNCQKSLWVQDNRIQCLGDYINPSKTSLSISLKGLVGAILTSVTDQKSFTGDILPVEVFTTAFCQEELDLGKSEEDSNGTSVRMICDVDDVNVEEPPIDVGASAAGSLGDKKHEPEKSCEVTLRNPPHIFSEDSSTSVATPVKTSGSRELFCWNCGTKGLKEWMPECQNCGKEAWTNPFTRKKPEEEQENESVFEEALSEPYCSNKKASVTCMGDLTKAAKGKKSASTLTAASDMASSWIGKLTEDIKSKILNLTPFKKKEMMEEKSANDVITNPGAVEFKITADTPVGVFDVTVKQYKNGKELSEFSVELADAPVVTVTPLTDSREPKLVTDFVSNIKDEDFYWSNESLNQLEYEPIEADSNSGEDEMEEFTEGYTGDSKQKKETQPPPVEKSTLAEETLKTDKAPFFEIQKCQPKYFVQEVVLKSPETPQQPAESSVTLLEEGKFTGVEHKLVIEGSSDDLIIYIQVEVEGGEGISKEGNFLIKSEEGLNDVKEDTTIEHSLNWKESLESVRDSDMSCDVRKKTVTFIDETSELMMEKEIRQMLPEEEPGVWDQAVTVVILDNLQQAYILVPQNQQQYILRTEPKAAEERKPVTPPEEPLRINIQSDNIELEKALNLLRDIENDIIEVKLSDAISILPNLESELRKHLQHKMKSITDKESGSLGNYFSIAEFRTGSDDLPDDRKSDDSEERLQNLLSLLSDLEEAVKTNEVFKDQIELCDHNSSKIYQLLHALANSIRELEDDATIVSLAETLDIASELDTAVREYDSIVKKQPMDYVTPGKGKKKRAKVNESQWEKEDASVKEHLKNVRKRVFEIVEEEAVDTEGRIERDFDRIDRLEKENEEAMKFVEAFLEKTQRRAAELSTVKTELRELSMVLNEMYVELAKVQAARNSTQSPQQSTLRDHSPPAKEVPVRDTISGLLLALNDLKTRAREKNEVCRGILERVSNDNTSEKQLIKKSSRSSRSSYTAKNAEALFSSVKEFKQIGENSLYLSWTKPEGALEDSIIGYEIFVNGKLNQKVRNPQRLQAVLYSVNLSEEAEVQLFAMLENEPRVLLLSVTYLNS